MAFPGGLRIICESFAVWDCLGELPKVELSYYKTVAIGSSPTDSRRRVRTSTVEGINWRPAGWVTTTLTLATPERPPEWNRGRSRPSSPSFAVMFNHFAGQGYQQRFVFDGNLAEEF